MLMLPSVLSTIVFFQTNQFISSIVHMVYIFSQEFQIMSKTENHLLGTKGKFIIHIVKKRSLVNIQNNTKKIEM